MKTPAVLVVDDDPLFCQSLVDYFAGLGVEATYVTSYRAAASQPLTRFAVVVVDNHLPDGEGLALVDAAQANGADPSFIVVTGDPSYDHAIAAMRRRVVDYLAKPIELDALGKAIERACRGEPLTVATPTEGPGPPLLPLSPTQLQYAQSEVSILIRGETGTGKSRVARAIHAASPRAAGPFVALNCAALPESLIDAELFGSRRGAFTGAAERRGLLALGDGGTLFLDEIGELSISAQAKLLAVLEDRRVRALGDTRWRDVDVRVLAATHVDLRTAVAAGRFRSDLLYRLDVGQIHLPPLRTQPDRMQDAVSRLLRELNASHARLAPSEHAKLCRHDWPGNYRQLRNALARALVLHDHQRLRPSQLLERSPAPAVVTAANCTLAEVERRHLEQTLAYNGGHRARTARALGISEATLRRKLRTWSAQDDPPQHEGDHHQNDRLDRSL